MNNFIKLAGSIALSMVGFGAVAQTKIPLGNLQIESYAECRARADSFRGKESGSQWLIRDTVEFLGRPSATRPLSVETKMFERVNCYNETPFTDTTGKTTDMVFVTTDDFSKCGWVDRTLLLDEHQHKDGTSIAAAETSGLTCRVPQAKPFKDFCDEVGGPGSSLSENFCEGLPLGLRSKGILTGSTVVSAESKYPFLSSPTGTKPRSSKLFFSTLTIHRIAKDAAGNEMVLVGDGEGDMFGWIALEAIQLWPTRLGLFYDRDAQGSMFESIKDLKLNWRDESAKPTIKYDQGLGKLNNHLHGPLPLLTYPIVRTNTPELNPRVLPTDVSFHEVVFLGQTGEGSASQLMGQGEIAKKITDIQDINVQFVVDTTESMTDYLPLIRQGIYDYIVNYQLRSRVSASRLPRMRVAVVAYSDFINRTATGLGAKIKTQTLLKPTTLSDGFDSSRLLEPIVTHKGLSDDAGAFEEASFEAVLQLAKTFDKPSPESNAASAWFDDGPRVVIHIADHGSRSNTDFGAIKRELRALDVIYLPVAVLTDDKGQAGRSNARKAFLKQATSVLRGVDPSATESDVTTVDFTSPATTTVRAVEAQLRLSMASVEAVVGGVRTARTGQEDSAAKAAREALDAASSKIDITPALRRKLGITESDSGAYVSALSAYAPFRTSASEGRRDIDWTYTVALEPAQAEFLQTNFNRLCSNFGAADYTRRFGALIVKMAEVFAGEKIADIAEVKGILRELESLPNLKGSFLGQPVHVLEARATSSDPAVKESLKQDVCWISYHLDLMNSGHYAQPSHLEWRGSGYSTKEGFSVTKREYEFKPVVGAPVVYLPAFFFVVPSEARKLTTTTPGDCLFCEIPSD